MKPLLLAAAVLLVLLSSGCGGNGQKTVPPTSARIEPASVTLAPGTTQQFVAFLNGNTFPNLTWVVEGAPESGTITTSGRYVAPQTAGNYTVRVFVTDNPSIAATASVTVTAGVVVQITAPATIPPMTRRSTLDFDAQVTGATNTNVTWSSSGGTIDADGKFKAPDEPGVYTITATSVQNPQRSASVQVEVVDNASVVLEIEGKGNVVMQMNTDAAPNTTANMVSLVNAGFYDGIILHRYEPGFVIQGGDPLTKTLPLDDPSIGTGGPGYRIPFENTGLLHVKYAVAMARSFEMDSAGSQFYICLDALPNLDGAYAVFGMVTAGFDVVDELRRGDKIVRATVIK